MKLAIRNYNLDFEKTDKKVVLQFVKQAIKQTEGSQDVNMVKQNRLLCSIQEKVSAADSVKFTKEEYFALKNMIVANQQHLKKQLAKAGFFKKFFLKSLEAQYSKLVSKYFQDK